MKTKQQKYLTRQHSDVQDSNNEILLITGRERQNNSEALKEAYCYFQQCLLGKPYFCNISASTELLNTISGLNIINSPGIC